MTIWRMRIACWIPKATATLKPQTTQHNSQDRQTDKEVEIKNITVYVSCYTETDTTGMLSPPTVWRQQSEFEPTVWSDTCCSAHRIWEVSLQCSYKYGHACRIECSHTCLRCMPRQMLVCCVVSVLAPMLSYPKALSEYAIHAAFPLYQW